MTQISFESADRDALTQRRRLPLVLQELGVKEPGPSPAGSTFYKSLLACPREHALSYVVGLETEHPSQPLTTGTLFHLCLERYYLALQKFGVGRPGRKVGQQRAYEVVDLLADEPGYGASAEELRALLDAYLTEYDRDEPWEILAVEETVQYALGDFRYTTRLDLLVRDLQRGGVWIVEHKSARYLSADLLDNYQMDLQVLGQIWLVNEVLDLSKYGPFKGTLINIATKQSPPRLHRHEVLPSPGHLRAFEESMRRWVRMRQYAEHESWPQALGHCAGYARGYSRCQFYDLCHGHPEMTVADWKDAQPPLGFVQKGTST